MPNDIHDAMIDGLYCVSTAYLWPGFVVTAGLTKTVGVDDGRQENWRLRMPNQELKPPLAFKLEGKQ